MPHWLFLSHHSLVLLCVAVNPTMRLREIGDRVGITERAAHRLVSDLVAAGYVTRTREGSRNRYAVNRDQPLRHELLEGHTVGELLDLYAPDLARLQEVS